MGSWHMIVIGGIAYPSGCTTKLNYCFGQIVMTLPTLGTFSLLWRRIVCNLLLSVSFFSRRTNFNIYPKRELSHRGAQWRKTTDPLFPTHSTSVWWIFSPPWGRYVFTFSSWLPQSLCRSWLSKVSTMSARSMCLRLFTTSSFPLDRSDRSLPLNRIPILPISMPTVQYWQQNHQEEQQFFAKLEYITASRVKASRSTPSAKINLELLQASKADVLIIQFDHLINVSKIPSRSPLPYVPHFPIPSPFEVMMENYILDDIL